MKTPAGDEPAAGTPVEASGDSREKRVVEVCGHVGEPNRGEAALETPGDVQGELAAEVGRPAGEGPAAREAERRAISRRRTTKGPPAAGEEELGAKGDEVGGPVAEELKCEADPRIVPRRRIIQKAAAGGC